MISEGVWEVTTASGAIYVLDFEECTLLRTHGEHQVDWPLAELRKDGEAVTFVTMDRCEPGRRMRLLLSGVNPDPGVYTWRETTPVVSIRRRA